MTRTELAQRLGLIVLWSTDSNGNHFMHLWTRKQWIDFKFAD